MAQFGFLSSFPPTRCGLATFTDALATSMAVRGDGAFVVRVVDESSPPAITPGPIPIAAEMRNGMRRSIDAATRTLNTADVAIIQHEYGIYGGPDGREVLDVLDGLAVPSIAVLHTVLANPTDGQRHVLEQVVRRATTVVVMTEMARSNLERSYVVDASIVQVIPHGVTPFVAARPTLSVSPFPARPVILTWGLIGPGKGIERGIRALAELQDLRPRPIYRVLGQTHPKVLAQDGDAYRDRLHALVSSLGLGQSVVIDGRYLSLDDLARAILDADVVLLPYDNAVQVTSGVLAEAIAAGKPVVATAFPHAIEALSSGAGIVVGHDDPGAMAAALRTILSDRGVAARMATAAARVSRETLWPAVGARYRRLAVELRATVDRKSVV